MALVQKGFFLDEMVKSTTEISFKPFNENKETNKH